MNSQYPYDDNFINDTNAKISSYKNHNLLAFRCDNCGGWNRSLTVHCTRCGELLKKPENWSMAQMNNRRTPTLRKTIRLPDNYGFDQPISLANGSSSDAVTGASLPSMLTADSYLIFPNPYTKCFQVHNVVHPKNPKILEIPFGTQMDYTQSPVFWGKHLYSAQSGRIFSVSLPDGDQTTLHEDNTIDSVPDCTSILAPLTDEEPVIGFVLSTAILLYAPLRHSVVWHVAHNIQQPDKIRSPVYFAGHLVFTTENGRLLALNLSTGELRQDDHQQCYFSAPVIANQQVCFEVVRKKTWERYVGRYHPREGRAVYQPLIVEKERGVERHPRFPADSLTFPPLSDGVRLIFTDSFGKELFLYSVSNFPNDGGIQAPRSIDTTGQITPPRSVIVGGSIYATSHFGLTIYNLNNNRTTTDPLLVRGQRDIPITSPICYGDKLFVLCQKNVFCRQI